MANPGKTVEQAIEALADAGMGESARLVEFGVKMTSEELQNAGGLDALMGEGGKLNTLYSGASEKLGQTTSGKISTLTGKVKSGMADMGKYILDAFKDTGILDGLIAKVDEFFNTDKAKQYGQMIIDVITRLTGIKDAIMPALKPIQDMFTNMFSGFDLNAVIDGYINILGRLSNAAAPIIDAFCGIIEEMAPRMAPLIENVISMFESLSPAFVTVVNMITPVLDFFMSVFEKVSQFIIDNSDTINEIIGTVGEIWEKVWGALSTVLEVAWAILEPIFSALLDILGGVLDLINGFLDGIGKVGSWIGDKWNDFTSWLGGGDDDGNPHASGLNKVPYDGYKAVLHQGEMVLPRMEADRIRQGGNSATTVSFGNISINSNGNPAYDAKEFVKEVSIMLTNGLFNNNPVI